MLAQVVNDEIQKHFAVAAVVYVIQMHDFVLSLNHKISLQSFAISNCRPIASDNCLAKSFHGLRTFYRLYLTGHASLMIVGSQSSRFTQLTLTLGVCQVSI